MVWYMAVPPECAQLTAGERAFNKAMPSVRVTIEWSFTEVKLFFPLMTYMRKLKFNEAPIGTLCNLVILVTDIHT